MVRAEDRDRLTGGEIRWGTETRKVAIHSSLTTNKTSDQDRWNCYTSSVVSFPPFPHSFLSDIYDHQRFPLAWSMAV